MKAPDNIYVCNNVFPTHVDWDGSPINTKRIDDSDIEYTQTDAFIEKACDWIERNMDDYIHVEYDTVTGMPTNEAHIANKIVIDDFRKYMKGE